MSSCLTVSLITNKIVNGFWRNFTKGPRTNNSRHCWRSASGSGSKVPDARYLPKENRWKFSDAIFAKMGETQETIIRSVVLGRWQHCSWQMFDISHRYVYVISWQYTAQTDGTMMGWLDCGTGKLVSSSSSVSGGGGLGGAVSRGSGGLGGAWSAATHNTFDTTPDSQRRQSVSK